MITIDASALNRAVVMLANIPGAGVFERVGRSRFPIKKMTGPSTPSMLASPNVSEKIVEKMEERLNVNVDHEINAFLNGFRG